MAHDDLDAMCCSAAQIYRLTSREVEVLRLLACGRDRMRVALELGISVDTVKTHIKHLYAKAGVRSKQDLIDILEDAPSLHVA